MRLLWLFWMLAGCSNLSPTGEVPRAGSLGVTTSTPTEEVALQLALPLGVRPQGRVVERVAPKSAAQRMGIEAGGVILSLDDVALFSADDLNDVLAIRGPGATVTITYQRPGERDRVETQVTLGTGPPKAAGGIEWQFASLGQMGRAKALAGVERRLILVGLSGADT
jgi:S1-C subfamily serine protease